jgi:hypothetical protein
MMGKIIANIPDASTSTMRMVIDRSLRSQMHKA